MQDTTLYSHSGSHFLNKLRIIWPQGGFLSFFDMVMVGSQGPVIVGRKDLQLEEDLELYRYLEARLQRSERFPLQITIYFVDDEMDSLTRKAELSALKIHESFFLAEYVLETQHPVFGEHHGKNSRSQLGKPD